MHPGAIVEFSSSKYIQSVLALLESSAISTRTEDRHHKRILTSQPAKACQF